MSSHFMDRIGEDTDPADCALCLASSCFSCVHGYCTALEKYTDGGCSFYKDADENCREIRKCFYRLIRKERFDLLRKYADTMAALGLIDDEIASAGNQRQILMEYKARHLSSLRDSNWKETLVMVSSLEDAAEGPEPMQEAELMQEAETEAEETFDNDLGKAVFPDGMSSGAIDDETAEEAATRDSVLQREIQDFQPDAIMESLQESQDYGMDELPPDYPEDFGWDELGSEPAEAGTEEAGEAEREKAAASADYARIKAEAGETEYE